MFSFVFLRMVRPLLQFLIETWSSEVGAGAEEAAGDTGEASTEAAAAGGQVRPTDTAPQKPEAEEQGAALDGERAATGTKVESSGEVRSLRAENIRHLPLRFRMCDSVVMKQLLNRCFANHRSSSDHRSRAAATAVKKAAVVPQLRRGRVRRSARALERGPTRHRQRGERSSRAPAARFWSERRLERKKRSSQSSAGQLLQAARPQATAR